MTHRRHNGMMPRNKICRLAIYSVVAAVAALFLPRAATAATLKIGYGAFSLGYAQIWVTKEAKLFEKNGLDVDVLYLESNLVRTALISGDVPIGAMSGVAMAAPKLQGADLVIILGFQNYLPFRFVVRPEIKTAADLKGKRIGVAGFGLIAERAARIIISKLGLNPAKDVTLLQTGGESTRLAALLGGSIDATVLNPPVYKRAVEAGLRVMANMEDLSYPYLNAALLTTHRFAASNPDVIRRVVKSFVEGTQVSKTNPEVTKRALGKYLRLKTEKEREEAYEILGGFTQRKPYPSLEGIKNILADLNLPAAKTADPKDFVDTRYLEELDRSGFIDGLYR